jgi:hypothetical protein
MTLVQEAPVVPPDLARSWLRRNRGLVLLGAGLLVALVLLVVAQGVGRSGSLDPDSYEPAGGHALAALLRDQGVTVQRTGDVTSTLSGLPSDATVLVAQPTLLSALELSDLQSAGAHLVVVDADPQTVDGLGLQVQVESLAHEADRDPAGGWAPALAASTVRIGGWAVGRGERHEQRCYDGTVVQLPDQDLVLLGSSKALSNQRLGDQGNAELGLQLLGTGSTVRWLVPDPNRAVEADRPLKSLGELLPDWVVPGERWLLLVVLVMVVWRGRRLGRVVPEPLPVVVRSAETVEGRGRLYRAAGARGTAAEALRGGALDRLARRLGAGLHPTPETMVELVAGRSARAAPEVQALLYGPPPADDDALVRLARDLDALTSEVSGS